MLKIKISNRITIENPPKELVVACKKALLIPNPAYHKNKAMGLAVWPSMMYFKYYKELPDGGLAVPRGFRIRLLRWCDKVGIEYEVKEFLINKKL